jgi:hypothetical protein
MATETIFTEGDQAAIFYQKARDLAGDLAVEWEKTLDNPGLAPAMHIGAIEGFIDALVRLGGLEPTIEFLEKTTAGLREAAQKLEAESKSQASAPKDVGTPRA